VISEDGAPEFDEIINERLEAGRHDLALKAYQASLEHQAQLSPDVMASLFQIAAWNNLTLESDFEALRPSETDEPEEIFLADNRYNAPLNHTRENLWENNGIAEDLWRRIPKTDALHCIFVQSLVRHGATQRAYEHFTTMIEEDKVVDLPTFNALLTWHNEIDTEAQLAENKAFVYPKLLTIMAERGVRPTTATFNAALHGLSDKRLPFRREEVERVLVEMIDCNARPTLGTMALMLKAWRTSHRYIPQQADWLLKILESGDLDVSVEDDYDSSFFPTLTHVMRMENLRFLPEIRDLIMRSHVLVRESPVYRRAATRKMAAFRFFIKESISALIDSGHMDDAMGVFSNYVPNYLQLGAGDWYHLLNQIAGVAPIPVRHVVTLGNEFSSMTTYGDQGSSDCFSGLLQPGAAGDRSELQALVAVAANYFRGYVYTRDLALKKQSFDHNVQGPALPPRQLFRFTGYTYGNILLTLAHGENLEDAIHAFEYYRQEQDQIVGAPPVEAVSLLTRRVATSATITNSRKGQVMVNCLKFFDEMGAKRHLSDGLDLMIKEVVLDASSAIIVAELKKELEKGSRKSPSRSAAN